MVSNKSDYNVNSMKIKKYNKLKYEIRTNLNALHTYSNENVNVT